MKAFKPSQPQGRLGKAGRAKATEREEQGHKVWFLPTMSTPLSHALPVHQELESELLLWAEFHHANILPFYGMCLPNCYSEGSHDRVGVVTDIEARLHMVSEPSHVSKHGYVQLP